MVSQPALITADTFDEFIARPENRDRLFELIHGEIVEVVSNGESSEIGMLTGDFLTVFVRQHKLGRVTGADGGYMAAGERYIPDQAPVILTINDTLNGGALLPGFTLLLSEIFAD